MLLEKGIKGYIVVEGYSIALSVISYADEVINTVKAFEAIRLRDEINYLLVYKEYLEAVDRNDPIAIEAAEGACDVVRLNLSMQGITSIEKIEEFANLFIYELVSF